MKVAQLIEMLQQMPQEAEVLTHANNHQTSPYGKGENMRVAAGTVKFGDNTPPRDIVLIGNWSGLTLDSGAATGDGNYPRLREPVLAVKKGEPQSIIREKIAMTVNKARCRYSGGGGWELVRDLETTPAPAPQSRP